MADDEPKPFKVTEISLPFAMGDVYGSLHLNNI